MDLDVLGVRVEMPSNSPIVLLRERHGDRHVPIWIGAPEATAIAYAVQGVQAPRPLTHDLIKNMLEELGHELLEVHITDMDEGVFYATLVMDDDVKISARPSDAIALALRCATPIRATEELLDKVGVAIEPEADDEVERFREFLDNVSAEDFESAADQQESSAEESDPKDQGEEGPETPN